MTSDGRYRPDLWFRRSFRWAAIGATVSSLAIAAIFGFQSRAGRDIGGPVPAELVGEKETEGESDQPPVDGTDDILVGNGLDKEVTESPSPVTTITEQSYEVLVEGSDENEDGIEIGSPWRKDAGMGTGWSVPWGDGFLKIGWPKVDNQLYDESHLVARSSADGVTWTNLDHYLVPDVGEHIGAVISDGERLLVASQTNQQVYMSATNDLIRWDTIEMTLERPEGLADSVQATSYVDHLAIGPNGWLVKITTALDVDILSLAGIRELGADVRTAYVKNVDYVDDGLILEWWPEEDDRTNALHNRRFFSWDDLDITPDLYFEYTTFHSNKPYIRADNILGSVWSTVGGADPVWVELPDIEGGTCCEIVGTDAGYLALSDPRESGYGPSPSKPAKMFFSSDGSTWDEIEPPAIEPPVGAGVWIHTIRAVDDGVVVSGEVLDDVSSTTVEIIFWLGDPDGSNWREIP